MVSVITALIPDQEVGRKGDRVIELGTMMSSLHSSVLQHRTAVLFVQPGSKPPLRDILQEVTAITSTKPVNPTDRTYACCLHHMLQIDLSTLHPVGA